jgi:predicted O-methyltransferase YrrM
MNDQRIDLNNVIWEYRTSRALQVANNLNIFAALAQGPMSVRQLSKRCRTKPDMTEKLLIACAAMGLVEKQGDLYANSKLAETYLVPDSTMYQGHIIRHASFVWKFWDQLADQIRLEPVAEEETHEDFILAMRDIAVGGRVQLVASAVDLTGRRKLFDVGGGPGTYSIAFCRQYPELRAVILDLPETMPIARKMIAEARLEDRIRFVPGSWDTHDFGEANDVVLLSNILHGESSKAKMKLKKAYESMAAGGLLVIQDFVLNDEKTGPLIPALFNIMVGAYCRAELFSVIRESGFIDPAVVKTSETHDSTIITAVKAG